MIIKQLLVSVVAIFLGAYLIPGVSITVAGALVLSLVLGIINMFIKPIVQLVALPLTIMTFGLFALVINALLIMLADYFVAGFAVSGFWVALLFALLISVVTALFGSFIRG